MPPRALTLSDPLAELVRAGVPVLELEKLPRHGPLGEAGSVFVLLDGRGEALGTGVSDPENGVFRVLAREELGAVDEEFFRKRAAAALAHRRRLGLDDGRSAYRLLNGEGDGLSGFAADVYGRFAVLYTYSRGFLHLARTLASTLLEVAGLEGVVVKVRPRGGPRPGKIKEECVGAEPPRKLVVYELGVPYEVHLLRGLNVGLFTDMREHRRNLPRYANGRRVLNLFAYTGSLSVAAARGGAELVTSVDLSSGVLKWARENFRLAGLDPTSPAFEFEVSDAGRFLERALEEGRRWEAVLIDPPTYSAARAASWSLKNDYPELISKAAALLPAGGILWLASNALRGPDLEETARKGVGLSGRTAEVLETGGLPPDYPTPLAWPRARYLQVLALRLD